MPADRSANQSYQSNHTDDTNQWPTPEAWWETALNITGRVAEMVGPFVPMVLGMLAAPKRAADEPFRITGPVQWYLAQSEGSTPRIFVKNTGRNEVALSFTGANQ